MFIKIQNIWSFIQDQYHINTCPWDFSFKIAIERKDMQIEILRAFMCLCHFWVFLRILTPVYKRTFFSYCNVSLTRAGVWLLCSFLSLMPRTVPGTQQVRRKYLFNKWIHHFHPVKPTIQQKYLNLYFLIAFFFSNPARFERLFLGQMVNWSKTVDFRVLNKKGKWK